MASIVAISGPAAVGKTTLCRNLCDVLPNSTYVSFDDYRRRECFPDDIEKWVRDGVDLNQIRSPDFSTALRSLRANEPIPGSPREGGPQSIDIVLTDEPFGRERNEISAYIDVVVFIKLPLDLGLARAIRRKADAAEEAQLFEVICGTLDLYLAVSRPLYRRINECVPKNCDLVLDGQRSIAQLTQATAAFIEQKIHPPVS